MPNKFDHNKYDGYVGCVGILITIIMLLLSARANAQLFDKLKKQKKDTTLSTDSMYTRLDKIYATVEKPVYLVQDIHSKEWFELPECKCIDMKGKKPGDVIVVSKALINTMLEEATRQRKRKTTR